MPRRALLALVSMLALGLTGLGPASSLGAADVAQAAQTIDHASMPPVQLRVVDHNIEHNKRALKRAVQRVRKVRAQVVTLQEICWWQAEELRRQHPQWTVAWKREQTSNWCTRRAGDLGPIPTGKEYKDIGNVAIWTGGASGVISRFTFEHQLDRTRTKGMACVSWEAGAVHRACSLHLLSADKPESRRLIRLRQAREVHRITVGWVRKHELVVLGGDFNSQPYKDPLDYIYDFRGRGDFREATPCKFRRRDCRRSQVTFDGGRTKIDYIFFSSNRMSPRAERSLEIFPTPSDHHLLSGWAYVDATPR